MQGAHANLAMQSAAGCRGAGLPVRNEGPASLQVLHLEERTTANAAGVVRLERCMCTERQRACHRGVAAHLGCNPGHHVF